MGKLGTRNQNLQQKQALKMNRKTRAKFNSLRTKLRILECLLQKVVRKTFVTIWKKGNFLTKKIWLAVNQEKTEACFKVIITHLVTNCDWWRSPLLFWIFLHLKLVVVQHSFPTVLKVVFNLWNFVKLAGKRIRTLDLQWSGYHCWLGSCNL